MKKLRILDYYTHQDNQYELFKTGHQFFLVGVDGNVPNWNIKDRPLPENVKLISEPEAAKKLFDVVIIRSPVNVKRYNFYLKRGSRSVAAVQTTSPYKVPEQTKHIVWNCVETMKKFGKAYYGVGKIHHHIVHGFDPDEFVNLHLKRNQRILTVANVFKSRANFMGYDLWKDVGKQLGCCDLIGHGNEDIDLNMKKADGFSDLINIYNTYSVFFNTTLHSAMPRSRGEAAMCGIPIVSTNNYGIDKYFKHKKSAILTNDKNEMIESLNEFLKSPQMCQDYGEAAREVAVKNFHIKDYIKKWNQVLESL